MSADLSTLPGPLTDASLLAARLLLGGSSVAHGLQKVHRGVAGFAAAQPVSLPLAWILVLGQTFAGSLLLIGVGTVGCAIVLAAISTAALWVLKQRKHLPFAAPGQLGWDHPLAHLAAALALIGSGPGRFALQPLL